MMLEIDFEINPEIKEAIKYFEQAIGEDRQICQRNTTNGMKEMVAEEIGRGGYDNLENGE